VKCEVCNDPIESEYWDDIERHLEACYATRPPRWRGKLEAFSDEELNAACQIIRCEVAAFEGWMVLENHPLPTGEAA